MYNVLAEAPAWHQPMPPSCLLDLAIAKYLDSSSNTDENRKCLLQPYITVYHEAAPRMKQLLAREELSMRQVSEWLRILIDGTFMREGMEERFGYPLGRPIHQPEQPNVPAAPGILPGVDDPGTNSSGMGYTPGSDRNG
jgi:hypothetical protein